MVEISEIGLKEEEEVELDLGLSIGGSFRRSEKIIQPDPNLKDSNHHHHHQQYQANVIMDPERVKREIHALRRMEAKKKREEKQQNKRHVMRESEPEFQNRASKREKTDLNLNATTASSTASFHHHPPYAYVQLHGDNSNNGYAYPCVVPWMVAPVPVPAVACGEKEKNAGQPEKGFRPFSPGNGYGSSEKDCCGADNNKKDKSDGSSSTTMCSSSVVSDYRSSSHEGGGSSESHSHSVHSVAAEPTNNNNNSKENNNMMITKRSHQGDQSQSVSSHPIITSDNSNAAQSTNNPHIDQIKPSTTKYNNKKPSSPNNNEMKKLPPKPQLPPSTTSSFGLQKMPYVSTTGNGPNGKRVNGFLYRYSSKSEVSIVCVCHGSTFSPAEFVQHAGGTDISHPERHITVIPTPSFC